MLWGNVLSGSKAAESGQGVCDEASAALWVAGGWEGLSEPSQAEVMWSSIQAPAPASPGGWSLEAEPLQLGKCRGGALPGGRGVSAPVLRGWGHRGAPTPTLASPLFTSGCVFLQTVDSTSETRRGQSGAPPSEIAKHQCQERAVHILPPALGLGVGKPPLMKKSAFGAEVKFSSPPAM